MFDTQADLSIRTFECTLERACVALQLPEDTDPVEVYFIAWCRYYRLDCDTVDRKEAVAAYERGKASGLTQDCIYTAIMTAPRTRT